VAVATYSLRSYLQKWCILNLALDLLITEHEHIEELQAKLYGDAMVLRDVEKSILENNLFGVDLKEESVGITKLSLWFRKAQAERKVNDLNDNIECGNSFDGVAIASEKALNWHDASPQVFENGDFDAFNEQRTSKNYRRNFEELWRENFLCKIYQKNRKTGI